MSGFAVPVNMREKRQENHMTQEEVAKRLHITRIHANRIENGGRPLTLDTLLDLVDLFHSLTIQRSGKRYTIAEDDGHPLPPTPDKPDRSRSSPYVSLSPSERIVRLGKELAEAKAQVDEFPRALLSPEARREYLRRLLKESIDVDVVIDALVECASPDVVAEAAAAAEAELSAECGEAHGGLEVRSA